mgnify:CR=1 FL=1
MGSEMCIRDRYKICSFDCIYCQLGRTEKLVVDRNRYISIKELKVELEEAIKNVQFDVVTLSGTGEPTLADNLGDSVVAIKEITDKPVAILTNSSMLTYSEVRKELCQLDIVVAKLDAPTPELFRRINRPHDRIKFGDILNGLREFRKIYTGKFSLQMMFVDDNKEYAKDMAEIARSMEPDEVQINTPLRESPVKPLSKTEISEIAEHFESFNTITVYTSEKPPVKILDKDELIKRRKTVL